MGISRTKVIVTSILLIPFFLVGCGTFSLGTAIPQTTKTAGEQQLDTLECKDKARLAASTADKQIGAFLLGMTIIGVPAAYEIEKSTQRDVYKSCMEGKGYRVLAPVDGPNNDGSTQVSSTVTNATLDYPAGWEKKDLTQSLISAGGSSYRINNSIDSGLAIFSAKLKDVGSANGYIQARVAAQQNNLDNASTGDIVQKVIRGFPVTQVEVTGNVRSGQKRSFTYLLTFFEASDEIVLVNVWAYSSTFPSQKEEFQKLLNTISGVTPAPSSTATPSPIRVNIQKESGAKNSSSMNRLNELNELLKKGLINQKDYDAKKGEILKSM